MLHSKLLSTREQILLASVVSTRFLLVQPEYFGDVIVVNGKAWPYMKVQRRKYRFRMINASNARLFNLALCNGLHFTQIGSDSFYLERPMSLKEILVAPSEIVDAIIDFARSKESRIVMTNSANFPYPDGDSVDDMNKMVMKFIVAN